jgi:hypothetical protein
VGTTLYGIRKALENATIMQGGWLATRPIGGLRIH